MKNFVFASLASFLIIFITSCTTSQLSSTERSYRNGHVVYKNKHQKEVRIDHARKVKSHKQKEESTTLSSFPEVDLTSSEKPKDNELVLASSSKNISIINDSPITFNNSLLISGQENSFDKSHHIITSHSTGTQVLNSPDTTVKKQDTSDYTRGTVYQPNQPPRKIEGFGVAGTITGIVGLFVAGIPLGILSLIFGFVCITRVKKNPKRRMGKGFGIAAIIIGLVDVAGTLIVLAMM